MSVELSPTVSEFERPDVTDFQWRRRKAAKLTQFFGVNHREVIEEVLSSIEHGLEFEQERGAIEAEEAEVRVLAITGIDSLVHTDALRRSCCARFDTSKRSGRALPEWIGLRIYRHLTHSRLLTDKPILLYIMLPH